MDARALKALEYDKIKKLLIARAETSLGVEVLERLKPLADLAQVSNRLRETSEGRAFLHDRGSPPFAGADDIAEPVRLAARGGVLGRKPIILSNEYSCRAKRNQIMINLL